MRVVVYPHDLGIGGSQINAIEIAGAVQRLGHDVIVFGRPGPLVQQIDRSGLEFIESPRPHRRPSPNVVLALSKLVRGRAVDIVHGYEWPPALEGLAAIRSAGRGSAVATVMSMSVAPFIPKYMPLVVGTDQIAHAERGFGRESVALIEPPVDLEQNRPDGDFGQEQFRATWGLAPGRLVVSLVTRLADELKLEGVLAAIAAIGELSVIFPVCLLIVGDGPARARVEREAAQVNGARGSGTVIVTGQLDDPRAAYAVADIALGMGGSALRSLAFGKPLVVQGEQGYWELLTPSSLSQFLWRGWYGIGQDPLRGSEVLASILRDLLSDEVRRRELGLFGLRTVGERFSLEGAARRQLEIYDEVSTARRIRRVGDDVRAVRAFAGYELSRVADRVRGTLKSDDFNSTPVAGASPLDSARRTGAVR